MNTGAGAEDLKPGRGGPIAELAAARVETARIAREVARLCADPAVGLPLLVTAVEEARFALGRLHEAAFAARLSLTR